MAKNKSSELVRKGTFLIIISVVIKFIGMIYRIPLTNMLGDQGNGSYVLAIGCFSAINIALGIGGMYMIHLLTQGVQIL